MAVGAALDLVPPPRHQDLGHAEPVGLCQQLHPVLGVGPRLDHRLDFEAHPVAAQVESAAEEIGEGGWRRRGGAADRPRVDRLVQPAAQRPVELPRSFQRGAGVAEVTGDESRVALQHLRATLRCGRRGKRRPGSAAAAQHQSAGIVATVVQARDARRVQQQVAEADPRMIHEVPPDEIMAVADTARRQQEPRVLDAASGKNEDRRLDAQLGPIRADRDRGDAVAGGVGSKPGGGCIQQDGQALGAVQRVMIGAPERGRWTLAEEDVAALRHRPTTRGKDPDRANRGASRRARAAEPREGRWPRHGRARGRALRSASRSRQARVSSRSPSARTAASSRSRRSNCRRAAARVFPTRCTGRPRRRRRRGFANGANTAAPPPSTRWTRIPAPGELHRDGDAGDAAADDADVAGQPVRGLDPVGDPRASLHPSRQPARVLAQTSAADRADPPYPALGILWRTIGGFAKTEVRLTGVTKLRCGLDAACQGSSCLRPLGGRAHAMLARHHPGRHRRPAGARSRDFRSFAQRNRYSTGAGFVADSRG